MRSGCAIVGQDAAPSSEGDLDLDGKDRNLARQWPDGADKGWRHFFSDVSLGCSDSSGTLPVPSSKVSGNVPFQRSAFARSTTIGLVFRISAFMRSTPARDSPSSRIPSALP